MNVETVLFSLDYIWMMNSAGIWVILLNQD